MNTKILFSFFIIGALAVNTADAQIRHTARNQNTRIRQGVRSGELTRTETRNLVHGQRAIRQDARAAKADGVVTPNERRNLRQDQRQESRKIFRKKHNRRDRN